MRVSLHKIFLAIIWTGLVACSGGAGSPEVIVGGSATSSTSGSNGLANQAGPVERPPVNVDSGPQGDCRIYNQQAADFEAEEVPELCLKIWEYARNNPLPVYTPPEANIPTRVIPTIEGPAVVNQGQILEIHPQIDLRDDLNLIPHEIQVFP